MFPTRKDVGPSIQLEKVLGLTASNSTALAFDSNHDTIAYPAGCTVVLIDITNQHQSHMISPSSNRITCLAFSKNGKWLVTGEAGREANVRVWNIKNKAEMYELVGHKGQVNCVAFHPNGKHVVSVGYGYDQDIRLWEFKKREVVGSGRINWEVLDMVFSENGHSLVTVGKFIKYWTIDTGESQMVGKHVVMGKDHMSKNFCSVHFGQGKMSQKAFCVGKDSEDGFLYKLNETATLEGWIQFKGETPSNVRVAEHYLYVGYDQGCVRVFTTDPLEFCANIPLPHHLGVDVATSLPQELVPDGHDMIHYPGVMAIAVDSKGSRLCCIYSDRSLYVWDVKNAKNVIRIYSCLFHSRAIWGIDVYPGVDIPVRGSPPLDSFITCSDDGTMRVWNLSSQKTDRNCLQRNHLSQDLLKIIYVDDNLDNIEANPDTQNVQAKQMKDNNNSGPRLSCVRVSPDGRHLVSGDRGGNIRVHDIGGNMEPLLSASVYSIDVLGLDFIKRQTGQTLMAACGRNGIIYVCDKDKDYEQTHCFGNSHSSSVQSVRFLESKNQLYLASCGGDKNFVVHEETNGNWVPKRQSGNFTFYDISVNTTNNTFATACQDRNIRVFGLQTPLKQTTFKGSESKQGCLVGIALDPTNHYAVTSCSDKSMTLVNFDTEECVATLGGHSSQATGMAFLNDGKHLITVSEDGCIFVWRLSLIDHNGVNSHADKHTNTWSGRFLPSNKTKPTPERRHPGSNTTREKKAGSHSIHKSKNGRYEDQNPPGMKYTEATLVRKLATSTPDLSYRGKRKESSTASKGIGSSSEWHDSPRRVTLSDSSTNATGMKKRTTSTPNLDLIVANIKGNFQQLIDQGKEVGDTHRDQLMSLRGDMDKLLHIHTTEMKL